MPPTPEARATADRFMFDTGNLKYFAMQLPKGGLERIATPTGWSVRQTLAHLADAQGGYAEVIEGLHHGVTPAPETFDPTVHNAEVAASHRETPLPEIIALFDSSIRWLVAALLGMDEAVSGAAVGVHTLQDALRSWSNHAAGHGMEMLDVVPELRDDALLLNWLLYENFADAPGHLESQRRLLEELREKYPDHDDGADEDDDGGDP